MCNRGDWSNTKDRFIAQFHENLVKVTFDHFKKQKEVIKQRVDQQKDYNEEIKRKIQLSLDENRALQKEADKYKTLSSARNDDYERIVVIIRNELEDTKTKVQEIALKSELKESKRREFEVDIHNERNKLTTESQKVAIAENKLELQKIKRQNTEESIEIIRREIHNLQQSLESLKSRLAAVSDEQNEIRMKYVMAKDFGKNIIEIHDQLIHIIELMCREKQSLLISKILHEKVNSKLINTIIMKDIPHNTVSLHKMMTKLDELNTLLAKKTTNTEIEIFDNCVKTKSTSQNQSDQSEAVPTEIQIPTKPLKRSKKQQHCHSPCLKNTTTDMSGHGSPEGGDTIAYRGYDDTLYTSQNADKLATRIEGRSLFADDVMLLYRNNIEPDDSTYE
ncbi:hypothetical protein M8J76_001439 [Diaphorina citri]|nr:hypothetical protein M8J75_003359 [Diaphorina citri]KAI5729331.1 hypothetical protein M8J76_001439 [Diaphorina citri]KAI5734370.1 hypothetical protein M8J77_005594 [Diaphorina citri]